MEKLQDMMNDLNVNEAEDDCYDSLEAYFLDMCRSG